MQKKFSFLLIALILGIGAAALIGCSSPTSGGGGTLEGIWMSTGGDSYTITATTFFYDSGFSMDFGGTREKTIPDGSGAGYIIIKFTENDWNSGPVGEYYVIHYKELSSSSIQLSSAYKTTGADSKGTLEDAEAEFTTGNGYFGYYGTYTR